MMAHSEIEAFLRTVRSLEPRLAAAADRRPVAPTGRFWIDIRLGDRFAGVSWRASEGFGFYDEDAPGFGEEAPLMVVRDPGQAAAHAVAMLRAHGWPLGQGLAKSSAG
jgi:hypothetical protein